jgi:hypothetical protein
MSVDFDATGDGGADSGLWPPPGYHRQVERLRAAVGETIYLAELADTEVQLAMRVTDHPFVLLDVIDFPRPDPARGLAPHLVLLDDGRGVNLGRIARITLRPFNPAPGEVLYLDREADRKLLFAERRLTAEFITERSRSVLGQVLGRAAGPALAGPGVGVTPRLAVEPGEAACRPSPDAPEEQSHRE